MKLINDVTGEELDAVVLFCLHCDKKVKAEDVWKSERHACPTPGCDGEGIGVDLYDQKWWE